jgi:hypothetical protein
LEDDKKPKPKFIQRLENVETKGGDDACEDIEMGFEKAMSEMTWKGSKKFLVLVADAPSHGKKFNGGAGDNNPEDDMTPTIKKISEFASALVGLEFNDSTNVMYEKIKEILDDKFFLHSIKSDKKDTKSIATQMAKGIGGSVKITLKRKIKKID